MSFIKQVEGQLPLLEKLHLGHTPFQVEFFKTSQQRGSRKFEYWQHLVQIKSLAKTVEDLTFDLEEALIERDGLTVWWKPKTAKAKLKLRRIEAKIRDLDRAIQDKQLECYRHINVLRTQYADLKDVTEAEILAEEEQYWVQRLSRQMVFNRFAAEKGLSPGDVQAIASLPPETTQKILQEAQSLLTSGKLWSTPEPKKLEG